MGKCYLYIEKKAGNRNCLKGAQMLALENNYFESTMWYINYIDKQLYKDIVKETKEMWLKN